MTTPDLAPLRTIVEALARRRDALEALAGHQRTCRDCQTGRPSSPCGSLTLAEALRMAMAAIDIALPAAQAALDRMDLVMVAPNGRPCDPGCWPHDHSSACYRASVLWLRARLAELKEAQAQSARDVADWRKRAEGAEALVMRYVARQQMAEGRDE